MGKGGGAWKVAYADFITAMMALFMVLWILGSEEELLEHMQEYFRNPPSPWDREAGKYLVELGEFEGILGEDLDEASFVTRGDPAILTGIIEDFYKLLRLDMETEKVPPVEMVLTSDGLRMVIFDRKDTPLFKGDTAEFTDWGEFLMQNLAWLLTRHSFDVIIEGHSNSDVRREGPSGEPYGPWELSVDRSNKVRRTLEFYASGQPLGIQRVVGYGDTQPVEGGEGNGRVNRRVTLSLSMPGPGGPSQTGERG